MNLELLRNFLPLKKRGFLDRTNALLAVITVGIFAYAIIDNAIFSFRRNESLEGTVELPIWPTKFIIVVGVVFFFIQALLTWLDAGKGNVRESSGREPF